jgi:hypothetical protein
MSDQFILIQTQKNHAVQKKKKSVAVLMNVRWHLMNGKPAEMDLRGKSRGGGGGGGGMSPIDLERLPGKRPLKMKAGGSVKSSASKRADGIAKKGKTRGKMV